MRQHEGEDAELAVALVDRLVLLLAGGDDGEEVGGDGRSLRGEPGQVRGGGDKQTNPFNLPDYHRFHI